MAPALSFTVRRAEPVLVAPAEPTPHELKPLSDIDDQDGNRYNAHAINFYPHHPSKSNVDPASVIRDALAKTLVFFYPIAGRLCELANRKLAVDCTAEGILFISASADISLADFGPNPRPPFPCMDELIYEPEGSGGMINTPLVLIQVTRLRCGGFILGLRNNHAVCDAQGIVQFLHAVGEIARGASAPRVLPVWERHLFSARNPPHVTHLHPEYEEAIAEHDRAEMAVMEADDEEELQYRSFFFGPVEIAALRGHMPETLHTCSRFDVVTAAVWRSRTSALRIQQGEVRAQSVTERNNMHASRVSDFGSLEQSLGIRVDAVADLGRNPALNTKPSEETVTADPLQILAFSKPFASTEITPPARLGSLPQRRGHQPSLVSLSSGHIDNWGDSMMAVTSPRTDTSTDVDTEDKNQRYEQGQTALVGASDSSDRSKEKAGDQKTLRRLAQNREAARKSRLRKKAYVQQLESSRLKLTQLEQELQRARQQGIFISSSGDQSHSMGGNGALAFDAEYARWVEEQNRQINELRAAVNAHASDTDLRAIVDGIMAHYDEIFKLKSVAAKADVFHMLSGMWKTPAERCFLWLGGFRSSELLKLLVNQLEPLTEQQLVNMCNLQQSSQQAEDALSQGMEALQQSLAETLAGSLAPSGSSGNVANYMGQMAMAMGKLGTLENFLRQADNLRQQTLQQMHRILTTRQSARALLAISDYFSRLRALSSLWLARPRE